MISLIIQNTINIGGVVPLIQPNILCMMTVSNIINIDIYRDIIEILYFYIML